MSLIGSIIERKPGSTSSAPPKPPTLPASSGATGFPAVQHRSKSVFARNRDDTRQKAVGNNQVPFVVSAGTPTKNAGSAKGDAQVPTMASSTSSLKPVLPPSPFVPLGMPGKGKQPDTPEDEQWRKQISEENNQRIQSMSQEEVEEEKREILERFGAGIGDLFRKVREAREKRAADSAIGESGSGALQGAEKGMDILEEVPIAPSRHSSPPRANSPPPPALTRGSTRPSSRADRKLRFAELSPDDVHVYESAPPSPKRKPLALPSPLGSQDTVSLGEWKGKLAIPAPKRRDDVSPPQKMEEDKGFSGTDDIEVVQPSSQEESATSILAAAPQPPTSDGLEEGTPEDIRRRFFPDAPANDPNLAWISGNPQSNYAGPTTDSPPDAQRFDLHGTPIPTNLSTTLPTHLGLHHHAEGTHAGYTLDDVFLLTRSTVPAQRATMLSVLSGIARRGSWQAQGKLEDEKIHAYIGKEEELRKRILGAGVNAMNERGSVGARAIEVVRECVVEWNTKRDDEIDDNYGDDVSGEGDSDFIGGGVALQQPEKDTAIASLQIEEYFLPQLATLLSQGGLTPESTIQVLDIIYRLAHNTSISTSIVQTKNLLSTILRISILTPIPPADTTNVPNPLALKLFIVLIKSSRSNASAVVELADPLLRFVTTLPPTSLYPETLTMKLLGLTLEVYRALAGYGLYAQIVSTAMDQFANLGRFIGEGPRLSSERHVVTSADSSTDIPRSLGVPSLVVSWLRLLEAWIVCAIDPHKTTPDHDILWSQIVGRGWNDEIWAVRELLAQGHKSYQLARAGPVWAAVWSASAAWLEGSRINGIKGGEEERKLALERVEPGFKEGGPEGAVLDAALDGMKSGLDLIALGSSDTKRTDVVKQLLDLSRNARIISSAIRLWLACTPSSTRSLSGPLASPPFDLPFAKISQLAATLVNHSFWSIVTGHVSTSNALCRPISDLLWHYLQFSRCLPGISPTLWVAQASTILTRLQPGDEDAASDVVEDLASLMTAGWLVQNGLQFPTTTTIWEKGGFGIVLPFLWNTIRPQADVFVGPLHPTPKSIARTTTQVSEVASHPSASSEMQEYGLPLSKDWTLSPLNHLLRSGTSSVFNNLPNGWDADEVEITSATLIFTNACRDILIRFQLWSFILTREEAVFNCMKVYMLEHGQPQNDSAEEVFRDKVVLQSMDELLGPYRFTVAHKALPQGKDSSGDLEQVARRFLRNTPFYQWYTDFVSLYDSISFSQPTFSALLLPPTSMRYPVDFRKFLWADYGHVIRNLKMIKTGDVISGDLKEYLWPVETDAEIIGAYLRRAVKGETEEFVRFVGVHHLACNIWRDLEKGTGSWWTEDRASKLLQAVLNQGGVEVIREVLRYNQLSRDKVVLPPKCFEDVETVKEERLKVLRGLGGEGFVERYKRIYEL